MVGVVVLVILLGGVAAIGIGLMGAMGSADVQEEAVAEVEEETTKLANLPKKLIDTAQNTVDQVNEKASTDEILGGNAPVAQVSPPPAPAATPVPAPVPPKPVLEEVSVATPPAPRPPANTRPTRDPAIADWVDDMRPSGFGRGKMIYNDRAYQEGDIVNPSLEVRWIKHDPDLGLLIFQDANGTIYEKDY
ncbi:MAG: hypothetical protein ACQKBV_08120 [Puniceicoccales bacterium]